MGRRPGPAVGFGRRLRQAGEPGGRPGRRPGRPGPGKARSAGRARHKQRTRFGDTQHAYLKILQMPQGRPRAFIKQPCAPREHGCCGGDNLDYVAHAMLCYAMLCYVTLPYAMLRNAITYYVMLCYVVICDAMRCDAMRCDAMRCDARQDEVR